MGNNSLKHILRIRCILILVVISLLFCNETAAKKRLFLLLGQSNMAGRAPITLNDFPFLENVYLLNAEGKFEQAKNPLNLYSNIRKETYRQRLGLGYSFSKAVSKAFPKDSILLVVNARGGTPIEMFMKANPTKYYKRSISRIKRALKEEPNATLEAIIWHQGESNRYSYEPYLPNLKKLITDYRKDLKVADLPLICGQLGLWNPTYKKIRNELEKIETSVPNAYLVSSEGLTNFDEHHFNSRSQVLLGLRYAAKYLEIKSVSEKLRLQATGAYSFKALKHMLHKRIKGQVFVAAHRGDWRNAPENSIQAIQMAIDMGVDIVEVDIALTKDSIPVLLHDYTLDRTTDCTGKPGDYTYADLSKCRLNNALGISTTFPVPTLEEALRTVKGEAFINLDKAEDHIALIYPYLRKTGTTDQAIFSSYDSYGTIKENAESYIDSILYMPKVQASSKDPEKLVEAFAKNVNAPILQTRIESDNDPFARMVAYGAQKGMLIWLNSLSDFHCAGHTDEKAVYDDSNWEWFLDKGSTIIQTDRPLLLLNYLRSKGLHH